ncbi:diacylglycerol/lipid kinase family protein [Aureibacillus halotolerans]|uniref:YegS/Rv2252/BmrU family lipid kinase n=1 Tax=Aureibacillus halotolerans TaxID=1508390 RepID=A0A4R6TT19_9BACI|nr:diacylglycerol kinase family protein [Aureibacillus halotolerans]TDQ36226.1 YegS/Rv2252/BmrU family lipid kinase [Aureibacillus halotolerans]
MKKALVIINPSSGKEKALGLEEDVVSALQETHEEVAVRYTEKEGDATTFAKEACEEKLDTVIALGGDGTVNEAINGLAEQSHSPTFGFLPLGTVNDFARALKLPMVPKKAIEVLKANHTKRVDIGKIDGRYFMNVLAVGAIAELVYEVTPEQKSKFGPFAYFIEGAKALKEKTPFNLSITYDDNTWNGEAYVMLVALTNSVAGFETFAEQAKVNDGYFHVFVLKDLSIQSMMKLVPDLLRGELEGNDQIDYFRAASLKVESSMDLVVNIDGDEGVPLPFTADVLHNALHILVSSEE